MAHTDGLVNFWSMSKCGGHDGVYHPMSPKDLDRYVREFSGRIGECLRVLDPQGSICWQVGNEVQNGGH